MSFSRRSFCQSFGLVTGLKVLGPLTPGIPFFETSPAQGDDAIYLDRNESAYGPSPKVLEAIQNAATRAKRYPRAHRDSLADAIANFHRVPREHVLLGTGSTDLLRMAAQAFLGPKRALIVADPTFGALEFYAHFTGAPITKVHLTRELAHDLPAMRTRVGPTTGLVYLCNPNNPTGTLTPRGQIEKFVASLPPSTLVIMDEAYHEFVGSLPSYASFIDRPLNDDRVLVLRTFSKAYGMAGLRLGYAVGAPKVLERMRAYALQDSINSIAASAGLAALESQEAIRDWVRRNDDDQQEFLNQANTRMLKPIDSHTNFVFMDVLRPNEVVIQHFRHNGIYLGPRFPSMPRHVRVSMGIPDEMKEFWRVWDLLPMIDAPM